MYGTIINVPTENYNYNPNQNFQSIPYTVNQLKSWSVTAIFTSTGCCLKTSYKRINNNFVWFFYRFYYFTNFMLDGYITEKPIREGLSQPKN